MKQNFKRTIAFLLIFSLIGGYLPSGVEASEYDEYHPIRNLAFQVYTSDVGYAGTDGDVFFKYTTRDGKEKESESLDYADNNEFERGHVSGFYVYDFGVPKDIFSWDIKNAGMRFKHKWAGADWAVDKFQVLWKNKDDKWVRNTKSVADWLNGSRDIMIGVKNIALETQVKIDDLDNFKDFARTTFIMPEEDASKIRFPVVNGWEWNGVINSYNYGKLSTLDYNYGSMSPTEGVIITVEGVDQSGHNTELSDAEKKYFTYESAKNHQNLDVNMGYSIYASQYRKLYNTMVENGINKAQIIINPNIGPMGEELFESARKKEVASLETQYKSPVNLNYDYLPFDSWYLSGVHNVILRQFTLVHDTTTGVVAKILTTPDKTLKNDETYSGDSPDRVSKYTYYYRGDEMVISVPIANPALGQLYKNWNNYDVDEIGRNFKCDAYLEVSQNPDKISEAEHIFRPEAQRYNIYSNSIEFYFDIDEPIVNTNSVGFKLRLKNIESESLGEQFVFAKRNDERGGYTAMPVAESEMVIDFANHIIDTEGIGTKIVPEGEKPQHTDYYLDKVFKEFEFKLESESKETPYYKDPVQPTEGLRDKGMISLYQLVGSSGHSGPVEVEGASKNSLSKTVLMTDNSVYSVTPKDNLEGRFKLSFTIYDRAGNYGGDDFYLDLDTLAPRISVEQATTTNPTQTEKDIQFKFNITDSSDTKLYYCFVKNENGKSDSLPKAPNHLEDYNTEAGIESPSTGRIDDDEPIWYYMDTARTNVGTTATLVAKQDEIKKGSLYYYAVDDLGNDTRNQDVGNPNKVGEYFKLDYELNFEVSEAELVEETPYTNYPQNYDISFEIEDGGTLRYYWAGEYDHDDDENTEDISINTEKRIYTDKEDVGSSKKTYDLPDDNENQIDIILDGPWTLHYEVTSKADNTLTYSKEFVFDNSAPNIEPIIEYDEISAAKTIRLMVNDLSNIDNLSYKVVDVDGKSIAGVEAYIVEDIDSNTFDRNISVTDLTTGAYRLEVIAEDKNGMSSGPILSEVFKIRTEAPTMSISNDFREYLGTYSTKETKVELELNLSENAESANVFVRNQVIQYRVSINGVFDEWTIATDEEGNNIRLEANNGKSEATIFPVVNLNKGLNEVKVELRFEVDMNEYQATYSSQMFNIISDQTKPEYVIDIQSPRDTKSVEAMSGSLSVSDDFTSADNITVEATVHFEEAIVIKPVLDSEGLKTGDYNLTFNDSVIGEAIRIIDGAGHETMVVLNVDSVDNTPPKIMQEGDEQLMISDYLEDTLEFKLYNANNPNDEMVDFPGLKIDLTYVYGEGDQTNRFGEYLWTKTYELSLTGVTGDYFVMVSAKDAAGNYDELKFEFDDMKYPDLEVVNVDKPENAWTLAKISAEFNRPVIMVPYVESVANIQVDMSDPIESKFDPIGDHIRGIINEEIQKGAVLEDLYDENQAFLAEAGEDEYKFFVMDKFGSTTVAAIEATSINYKPVEEAVKITTSYPIGYGPTSEVPNESITFGNYNQESFDYDIEIQHIVGGDLANTNISAAGTTRSAISFINPDDENIYGANLSFSGYGSGTVNTIQGNFSEMHRGENVVYYEVTYWLDADTEVNGIGKYTLNFETDMTAPELEVSKSHDVIYNTSVPGQRPFEVYIKASDDESKAYYDSLTGLNKDLPIFDEDDPDSYYEAVKDLQSNNEELIDAQLTNIEKSGIKEIKIEYYTPDDPDTGTDERALDKTVIYSGDNLTPQSPNESEEHDLSFQTFQKNGGGLILALQSIEENVEIVVTVTNESGLTATETIKITNLIDNQAMEDAKTAIEALNFKVNFKDMSETLIKEAIKSSEGIYVLPDDNTIGYYSNVIAELDLSDSAYDGIKVVSNGGVNKVTLTPYNRTYTFIVEDDEFGHRVSVPVRFDRFDTKAPEITNISIDDTEPTKGPVNVEFKVADNPTNIGGTDASGVELVELFRNSEAVVTDEHAEFAYANITNQKIVVKSNGVYTIRATDHSGNTAEEVFSVTNIDNTAPILSKVFNIRPDEYTKGDILATFTFNEPNVTVKTVKAVDLNGKTIEDKDFRVLDGNRILFKENGAVQLTFYDAVGNENQAGIQVTQIFRDKPAIEGTATTASDTFSALITFDFETGFSNTQGFKLKDYTASYFGKIINLEDENDDKNAFEVKENGDYHIAITDPIGNSKFVKVNVSGIDREAPVIESMTYNYDANTFGNTTTTTHTDTINIGVANDHYGYDIAADGPRVPTNNIVSITLRTDKDVNFTGGLRYNFKDEHTVEYDMSGTSLFTVEAKNGLKDQYAVGVHVIDLVPPTIKSIVDVKESDLVGMTNNAIVKNNAEELDKLEELSNLVFYENENIYIGREDEKYNKSMITDSFIAYDEFGGFNVLENVVITYDTIGTGDEAYSFNPDDIEANKFDRNKPYFVTYTVYDKAGNKTEVKRMITLVGKNDAVVRVNGEFPDSMGRIVLEEGTRDVEITLENSAGKGYARYEAANLTMGQMKINGDVIASTDDDFKTFKMSNMEVGKWYTIYVQTTTADYFVIKIAIDGESEE